MEKWGRRGEKKHRTGNELHLCSTSDLFDDDAKGAEVLLEIV